MKDAEFAALLEKLKEPARQAAQKKAEDLMDYFAGYLDALDDVRRAYAQAEGKGGSHDQANP